MRSKRLTLLLLNLFLVFPYMAHGQDDLQPKILPEELDHVYQFWQSQNKYFLIVAVGKLDTPGFELSFANGNATKLSDILSNLGYKALALNQEASASDDQTRQNNSLLDRGIISDEQATRNGIRNALATVTSENLDSDAKLLIYYIGHGSPSIDGKELYLQLYGDGPPGPRHGIALSELIKSIRVDESFEGELVILIDSCSSGLGVVNANLSLQDLTHQGRGATTIIASSADTQESYVVDNMDGVNSSAFSYLLLNGFTDEWETLDGDQDGIITSSELETFERAGLKRLYNDHHLRSKMTPFGVSLPQDIDLAYRRDKVKNWNSNPRQLYASIKINFKTPFLRQRVADVRSKIATISISSGGERIAEKQVAEIPESGTIEQLVIKLPPGREEKPLKLSLDDTNGKEIASKTIDLAETGTVMAYRDSVASFKNYEAGLKGVKATMSVTVHDSASSYEDASTMKATAASNSDAIDVPPPPN